MSKPNALAFTTGKHDDNSVAQADEIRGNPLNMLEVEATYSRRSRRRRHSHG